jgi:regulator of cell morphogenesis and NO signaling
MENLTEQTLASIVTDNHQAAPLLEKYQLDFCCKGKKTLKEACIEKGISYENIAAELSSINSPTKPILPFTEMSPTALISYILIYHHFYVKQAMPTIASYLQKIAHKHGDRYPYMVEVEKLFSALKASMEMHLQKEETILFPRIKEVETWYLNPTNEQIPTGFIAGPLQVMEAEHEDAGLIMSTIQSLTNQYTAPADACTTFKLCIASLKAFEEDLHKHVHLENYILFPKSLSLLQSIAN